MAQIALEFDGKTYYFDESLAKSSLSQSNKQPYQKLTYEMLQQFVTGIASTASRHAPIVLRTDKTGMKEFDKAVKAHLINTKPGESFLD